MPTPASVPAARCHWYDFWGEAILKGPVGTLASLLALAVGALAQAQSIPIPLLSGTQLQSSGSP